MSGRKQTVIPVIAHRTAEMLAMPQLVCRRRACRRNNRCGWHFIASGEPTCLRNLDAEQRNLFMMLHNQTRTICALGDIKGDLFACEFADIRERQDAGAQIARFVIPPWDRKRFAAFLRAREQQPPPRRTKCRME